MYCFFRAVTGYFCGGHVLAMVVLYNEMIGSSKRAIAGAYGSFTFSVGKPLDEICYNVRQISKTKCISQHFRLKVTFIFHNRNNDFLRRVLLHSTLESTITSPIWYRSTFAPYYAFCAGISSVAGGKAEVWTSRSCHTQNSYRWGAFLDWILHVIDNFTILM